jgi:hypothetical protein
VMGGRIETQNVSRWFETGNKLKFDEMDTHGMVVAWDEKFSEVTAQVEFALAAPIRGDTLVASLSAYDTGTLPDDWEEDEDASDEEPVPADDGDDEPKPLDWTITLTDVNGRRASLLLSADSGLYPLINAVPRRAGFLDSTEPTEVLYRRFEWPLSLFEFANPDFDASLISSIAFVFDQSPKGAIIVDDILIASNPQE